MASVDDDDTKSSSTSQSSGRHICHMCGQHCGSSRQLVAHIEEHKKSGLLMYFNLMDGQMKGMTHPRQVGSFDNSDACFHKGTNHSGNNFVSVIFFECDLCFTLFYVPRWHTSWNRDDEELCLDNKNLNLMKSLTQPATLRDPMMQTQAPTLVTSTNPEWSKVKML